MAKKRPTPQFSGRLSVEMAADFHKAALDMVKGDRAPGSKLDLKAIENVDLSCMQIIVALSTEVNNYSGGEFSLDLSDQLIGQMATIGIER